jgi:hypothetical protein
MRVDEGVNDDRSLVANQPLRQTNAGSSMLEEINVCFVAEEIVHLPGHHRSDSVIPVRGVAHPHEGGFSGVIRTHAGAR